MSEPRVELHLGDCLDVLRSLPDGSVDAVITDPPWKDYRTSRYDASAWHQPIDYVAPERYASLLYRALRADSACVVWCGWECFDEHARALREAGFVIRNCIVWAKPNHTAGDLEGNLGYQHEQAVFAVKGRWHRHGKRESNLWIEPHLFSRTRRHHPTEKPLGLMARSVELSCPLGGIVLDPFTGSGTTAVAAIETGRNFIGCEIDPAYHAIATKRIDDALNSQPLFRVQPPTQMPLFAEDVA